METPIPPSRDFLDFQPEKRPGMLNTLTILTFIGSGLGFLSLIWSNINYDYEKDRQKLEQLQDQASGDNFASKIAASSLEMFEKNHQYRIEILISSIIFLTLCVIGAILMRRLKKNGYYIYLVGEIGPIILNLALFGFSFISGITAALSGLVALVFIILYSTQLKYLRS